MATAAGDRVRVLVADDQRLLRQCFEHVLSRDPEIEVVGTAADGSEAVLLAVEHRPDVVLMDLEMPVMDGVQATALIHERCPRAKVLVLSIHEDPYTVVKAVARGIHGYIIKDVPPDELLHIVKAVHRGQPVLSDYLIDDQLRQERERMLGAFSTRETQMLEMLAEGMSNADMADRLYVSEQTVKRDMMKVLDVLQVDNRTRAAMKILQLGLARDRPSPLAGYSVRSQA